MASTEGRKAKQTPAPTKRLKDIATTALALAASKSPKAKTPAPATKCATTAKRKPAPSKLAEAATSRAIEPLVEEMRAMKEHIDSLEAQEVAGLTREMRAMRQKVDSLEQSLEAKDARIAELEQLFVPICHASLIERTNHCERDIELLKASCDGCTEWLRDSARAQRRAAREHEALGGELAKQIVACRVDAADVRCALEERLRASEDTALAAAAAAPQRSELQRFQDKVDARVAELRREQERAESRSESVQRGLAESLSHVVGGVSEAQARGEKLQHAFRELRAELKTQRFALETHAVDTSHRIIHLGRSMELVARAGPPPPPAAADAIAASPWHEPPSKARGLESWVRDLGGDGGGGSGGGGFETSAQHTAQPPHRGARSPCVATGLDAARETLSSSSLMRDFVVREDERERPSSRSSLSSSAGARSEADDYFDVRPPAPVMVTDDGTVLTLTAREGRGDAFAAGLEESRQIVRQVERPALPRMTVLVPARRPPAKRASIDYEPDSPAAAHITKQASFDAAKRASRDYEPESPATLYLAKRASFDAVKRASRDVEPESPAAA